MSNIIRVTLEQLSQLSGHLYSHGLGFRETFLGSHCRIAFWARGDSNSPLYMLSIDEERQFAALMYRSFTNVSHYADLHFLESGCRNLTHAVLVGISDHTEATRTSQPYNQASYYILNGCVQDSLGCFVQLGDSSPPSHSL